MHPRATGFAYWSGLGLHTRAATVILTLDRPTWSSSSSCVSVVLSSLTRHARLSCLVCGEDENVCGVWLGTGHAVDDKSGPRCSVALFAGLGYAVASGCCGRSVTLKASTVGHLVAAERVLSLSKSDNEAQPTYPVCKAHDTIAGNVPDDSEPAAGGKGLDEGGVPVVVASTRDQLTLLGQL